MFFEVLLIKKLLLKEGVKPY